VWLLADGSLVRTLEGHTGAVLSACVTPDGQHLVTVSADMTARVWLLADGSLIHTLEGHTGTVLSACATPGGQHLVTVSTDRTARVWLLANGSLVHSLEGPKDWVWTACVTPDGRHLVTVSDDRTARVWLLADGSLVHTRPVSMTLSLLPLTLRIACRIAKHRQVDERRPLQLCHRPASTSYQTRHAQDHCNGDLSAALNGDASARDDVADAVAIPEGLGAAVG